MHSPYSLSISRLLRFWPAVLCTALSASSLAGEKLRWDFSAENVSGKSLKGYSALAVDLAEDPQWDAEEGMSFGGKQFASLPEKTAREISQKAFTVIAKVKVSEPQQWGGIVSYSQDNGSYERGWILGYTGERFSFKSSNGKSLVSLNAAGQIPLGEWVVLAVSYDGKVARLYQNGQQVGVQAVEGKVVLPDIETPFVIGAYKDKDEFYGMKGAIAFVEMHTSALSAGELKKVGGAGAGIEFAVRPHLRFISKGKAEVCWHSSLPGTATVAYGYDKKSLDKVARSTVRGEEHKVVLEGLETGKQYFYRIGMQIGGKRVMGRIHEFNTALNYLPPVVEAELPLDGMSAKYLERILEDGKDHAAGYALVLGATNGDLALALAKQSKLQVIVVEADEKRVSALRQKAYKLGVYGRRLSVLHAKGALPVTGCIANLIISERALAGEEITLTYKEALRLLRPAGGRIVLPNTPVAQAWSGRKLKPKSGVLVYERPRLEGGKDWSHQYGNAANTTYTGEAMGNAEKTSDLSLQWLGRPGADFNIDRQPRVPAPLAVHGKLYHQGMNRIIALDAFNGAILWSMEVPDLRRLNVAHDSSNWCADRDHLYMAVEENAWVINPVSGEVDHYLKIPTKMRDTHIWGYIAHEDDYLVGTSVKNGSQFKDFWGSANWFDDVGSSLATTQVCSDALFAYRKGEWKGQWSYSKGIIINSTISVRDGKIFFLENRSPEWGEVPTGRIHDRSLWLNLTAVCLNLKTGRKVWEKPVPDFQHVDAKKGFIQSAYGVATEEGFLTVFSESVLEGGKFNNKGQFVYHLFDDGNGAKKWSQNSSWRHHHHGAHISHPVVMNGMIFVDPHWLNLSNGKVLSSRLAHRQKCPTPVAWKNGLMFRGSTKEAGSLTLVMWDEEKQSLTGWNRLRPSCWLNSLPAQGGLLMPEGGGGCSCGGWMETSVGFLPTSETAHTVESSN